MFSKSLSLLEWAILLIITAAFLFVFLYFGWVFILFAAYDAWDNYVLTPRAAHVLNSQSSWTEYHDQKLGIKFSYPSHWIVEYSTDASSKPRYKPEVKLSSVSQERWSEFNLLGGLRITKIPKERGRNFAYDDQYYDLYCQPEKPTVEIGKHLYTQCSDWYYTREVNGEILIVMIDNHYRNPDHTRAIRQKMDQLLKQVASTVEVE